MQSAADLTVLKLLILQLIRLLIPAQNAFLEYKLLTKPIIDYNAKRPRRDRHMKAGRYKPFVLQRPH